MNCSGIYDNLFDLTISSTQGTPKKAKSDEFDDLFKDDDLPF